MRVAAAGVNPSDVKAALGLMPQAVWPRTPGRDFAGTVVDGPADWIGREVWGSGGDLGITRDGSHAGWLLLPAVGAARQAAPADDGRGRQRRRALRHRLRGPAPLRRLPQRRRRWWR